MRTNVLETVMGGLVLLVAGFFLVFVYTNSGYKDTNSQEFQAHFDRVDGLQVGSDVRLSGVKIGIIRSMHVDPVTFLAKVTLSVQEGIKLPTDTSAEIVTDGLLGGKYVALVPGGEDATLSNGDQIVHTQASVSLEAMIGQLIFSNKGEKGGASQNATP